MGTILIVVVVILLLGSGGRFYGYRLIGGPRLGGTLGLILLILLVLWRSTLQISPEIGSSISGASPNSAASRPRERKYFKLASPIALRADASW